MWTLTMEDSDDTAFLLVGSTGQGKSSLGNFLLTDPYATTATRTRPQFQPARSNKPQTRRVEYRHVMGRGVRVVDTPGLNESDCDDLEHMIDVVKVLQRLKYISACILCIRFESKIDTQYKTTIDYYRNLLPTLFEANVVIVVTNYQTDSRSDKLRKMQGIDVDEVITNFQKEVIEIGHMTYRPQVFKIDSLPMDDAERQLSANTRKAIFDYIKDTLIPVDVRGLMVAKTAALLHLDAEKVAELEGEITGYNKRLQEVNQQAEEVLNQIEAKEKVMTEMKIELDQLKLELQSMDTEEPTISAQWSLEQGRKLFRKPTKDFKIMSEWPVIDFTKWDNGDLVWSEIRQEGNTLQGTVTGKFSHGLYASVILWTSKRFKYATNIDSLRTAILKKEDDLAESRQQYSEYKARQNKHTQAIRDLEKYIEDVNVKKAKLSRREMTLDEATTRLQELKLTRK